MIASTTSPGSARTIRKTSKEMPSRVGTASSSRRNTYCVTALRLRPASRFPDAGQRLRWLPRSVDLTPHRLLRASAIAGRAKVDPFEPRLPYREAKAANDRHIVHV